METPHITGAIALIIHEFKSQSIPYIVNVISRFRSLSKDVYIYIYILGIDNATGFGFVTFNLYK